MDKWLLFTCIILVSAPLLPALTPIDSENVIADISMDSGTNTNEGIWINQYASALDSGNNGSEIDIVNEYSLLGTHDLVTHDSVGNTIVGGSFSGIFSIGGVEFNTGPGIKEFYVVKIGDDGEIIWSTTGGSGGRYTIDEMEIGEDDSIYITGMVDYVGSGIPFAGINIDSATNYAGPFIAKLGSDGSWDWAKIGYVSNASYNAPVLEACPEGGAIAAIALEGNGHFDMQFSQQYLEYNAPDESVLSVFIVFQIDSTGTIEWVENANTLGQMPMISGFSTNTCSDVYLAGAAGYGASWINIGEDNLTVDSGSLIFVAKISGDGMWQWGKKTPSLRVIHGISEKSGKALIWGKSSSEPYLDLVITSISSSGNWGHENIFGNWLGTMNGQHSGGYTVEFISNNEFYVTGFTRGDISFGEEQILVSGSDSGQGSWFFILKFTGSTLDLAATAEIENGGGLEFRGVTINSENQVTVDFKMETRIYPSDAWTPEERISLLGTDIEHHCQLFHDRCDSVIALSIDMSDSDNDNIPAGLDNCPNHTNSEQLDFDQDRVGDACDDDVDGDYVVDYNDNCLPDFEVDVFEWPWDIGEGMTDYDDDGCDDHAQDYDDDNDGITDVIWTSGNGWGDDKCPTGELGWISTLETDNDQDGCRDSSEDNDDDNDGAYDDNDAFPLDPSERRDTDFDGIGDNADAFPYDPTEWSNQDGDPAGDNSDLWVNDSSEWYDYDLDGIGDNADNDDDNDGHLDEYETQCETDPQNESSYPKDVDDDDICDYLDPDDDNDGVPDETDQCPDTDFQEGDSTDFQGCEIGKEGGSKSVGGMSLLSGIGIGIAVTVGIAGALIIGKRYVNRDDQDENDDQGGEKVPVAQPSEIPSSLRKSPSPDLEGNMADDGYEWLEYPTDSDNWFWRDHDTGQWNKHQD